MIDGSLVALVVIFAAYTLWRGFTLQVDYYDGYRYLANARRLLGDDQVSFDEIRPPLLTLLQAPVVALARIGGPANAALVYGPHLLSTLLSLLTALALFFLFAPPCGRRTALVGTLLFMSTRYFVRYGAHVMTDVATAGVAAAAVAAWTRARELQSLPGYVPCGAALGGAMALKFSSALLFPALVAAELILTPGSGDRPGAGRLAPALHWRRWAGLALCGATAAALFFVVEGFVLWRVYGTGVWAEFRAAMQGARGAVDAWPGESWRDYIPMLQVMVSPTVVVLALAGMAAALRRPERRDAPFWTWLLLIGGSIVFLVGHNEARYLLPALPPFIYFALRGVESAHAFAPGSVARATVSLLVGVAVLGSVANGLAQAWSDQDPVFRRDVQRRAAALAAASVRDRGQLWILGKRHTLSTQDPGPVAQDEFWNTFHYERHVAEYFLGRSPRVLPVPNGTATAVTPRLAAWVADGDAILRFDDLNYYTRAFPPGPIPRPLEVWSVRRLDFHGMAGAPEMLVDSGGASLRVENGATGGELLLTADRSLGEFAAFVATAGGTEPRFVGNVRLSAGTPTPVLANVSGMPSSLTLVRVDVQKVGL